MWRIKMKSQWAFPSTQKLIKQIINSVDFQTLLKYIILWSTQ